MRETFPTGVALDQLAGYGAAFVALSEGRAAAGLAAGGEFVAAAERRVKPDGLDRTALWSAVGERAAALGAGETVRTALEHLQAGAPVVVTGQQPGLLGGPVFTLYKIATAIALARRLTTLWGRPVVPVFWSATYDTDFAEIARATVAGTDDRLHELSLDSALERRRQMVGALPVAAARPILSRLDDLWRGLPGAPAALQAAGTIWERGRDWGEGFGALLYYLFAGQELVVIDGRAPELRELARPLLSRYVEHAVECARRIEERSLELESAGFARQLAPRATAWSLMIEEGAERRSFDAEPTTGAAAAETSPEPWARTARHADRARAILAGDRAGDRAGDGAGDGDEQLWPGAALRPLVTDFTLPSVAHVMGPAEVAYMQQVAPAYALLGLEMPPVMPRLTMTWAPEGLLALAAAAGLGVDALLTDPVGAVAQLAATVGGTAPAAAVAGLQQTVEQEFARRREELLPLGRGIDSVVESVAGKIRFQLGRLREAVEQRQRAALRRERPDLSPQLELLAPRRGLQERHLAWLGLHAQVGDATTARALGAATDHVAALLGGRAVAHTIVPFDRRVTGGGAADRGEERG